MNIQFIRESARFLLESQSEFDKFQIIIKNDYPYIFFHENISVKPSYFENTAFGLFVASGFAFVYFTEKLLEFRKPGPKRQKKLTAMMSAHEEVAEYCRKVAEQGRYLVVMEYDAIVAHVQKIEGKKLFDRISITEWNKKSFQILEKPYLEYAT